MTGQDDIFSQTQSMQQTQPTMSFGRSLTHDGRETGDSFVSAKETLASKQSSKENSHLDLDDDAMDVVNNEEEEEEEANLHVANVSADTIVRHELGSSTPFIPSIPSEGSVPQELPEFPEPPRAVSDAYEISGETQEALEIVYPVIEASETRDVFAEETHDDADHVEEEEDGVVASKNVGDNDDQMDVDEDDEDGSSPVKPLVRKSSLTFASLPARQPLISKKSMGDRISRTSHVDFSKTRSTLGRFTEGKSLGGTQLPPAETQHQDEMDIDEERPEEESTTPPTKMYHKTPSQRILERIQMLGQPNEAPKPTSQVTSVTAPSQQSQPKEVVPPSPPAPLEETQPAYPTLPAVEHEKSMDEEDDDDDWISPVRTNTQLISRPALFKSHSADMRPAPAPIAVSKPIDVSNPSDLTTVVESTTPSGSPTGKKYMDGPLSASKAKFYSALRAAKEKIIGSSVAGAPGKLDTFSESPMRPKFNKAHNSSDDVFFSPKRIDKAGTSIFAHMRSPSKESDKSSKSSKSKVVGSSSSPIKDDGRRTRSSSERERQKDKDVREKEQKQKQRAEERLKEMREKEQSKAAAQYQKSKAVSSKTPASMSSQQSLRQAAAAGAKTPIANAQPRPGPSRINTTESTEEMPPPPAPKSLLPTTGHKLREPRKLVKAPSKMELPKSKPQKIMVNLNSSRYGQAPPPPARNAAPAAPVIAPPVVQKAAAPAPRPIPAARPGTAASNRPTSALAKSGQASKPAPGYAKSAPRMGRLQPAKGLEKATEKPKTVNPQTRADLPGARPISRLQTVQDVSRINVPPVNPAKPPVKRPFQAEEGEVLNRPAKRPSQQVKMNPVTPAHNAQFAKGKIPFAEPAKFQPQYQDGNEIELPACVTDSEDDSDNDNDAFEQPSWVNTPNLHQLLTQQQLVDPETIFGPIAPLNMEQVFPNKETHKKFRQRTSSAFWANDQVTEDEKRKEREARERLVREGTWTYHPSPLAPPRSER